MTLKFWLGLGVLLALLGFAYLRRASNVSPESARRLVAEGAILLDVRTPEEFAAGHLEGAVNIPVHEVEARLGELPDRDKPVVVYCRSGRRSAQAKAVLERSGYAHVHDLGPATRY